MRILFLSAYYWPEFSGTAPYVTAPAEYLAASGHSVDVIAGYPHYPQWEELEKRAFSSHDFVNGVNIYRRWHMIPSVQSARHRALYEASMLGFGALALASMPTPDVVIGVTPALASASLALLAAKRFHRPYGLVVHDLMGRGALQSGISTGRVGRLIERAELGVALRADRLLVLTDGMKQFFIGGGVSPAMIEVVPTWTLRPPPKDSRDTVRRSAGWAGTDFICLHGGNMGQKQGLDNLIDAARFLDDRPGIRIVLVGDGNDRRRLEQRAEELGLRSLDFMPMQPAERYDELVAAADVLLLNQRPAVSDMSLPSKLSAYFASGRPVIAAVAEGSPAALEIRRSQAGVVVDPGRPGDLAEALSQLRLEESRLEEMGANGRAYAASTLSSGAILPQYEQFAKAIAQSPRRSVMRRVRR